MESRERAAQAIIDFADCGLSKVFFCNSGAEANENALKLALKLTGRSKFVAFEGAFHGRTTIASCVTDNEKWQEDLHDWAGPVARLERNNFDQLDSIDSDVAAVILEPIQSMAGVAAFSEDYLEALRAKTKEVGALLIFDEVQTGVGRTGVPFVSGSCGVTPDMMTAAKALGSGVPVGALVMTEEVGGELKFGDLGSHFWRRPTCCSGS